ncbi:MAG: hypothetical protein U0163_20010 [Gemmatimonadaceae bacterium]
MSRRSTCCSLGLLLVSSLLATPSLAQHGSPASAGPSSVLTPASLKADLVVLRDSFVNREASYTPDARRQAVLRTGALIAASDTLRRAWLELEVARIAALADNGHTGSFAPLRAMHFNRVPFRLVPLGDDFYVLAVQPDMRDLLGARLTSIDGHPIAAVRAIAHTLSGGTPAWRDRSAPYFFESPELMHALGTTGAADSATYGFTMPNGRQVSRRVRGLPADPNSPFIPASVWMSPSPITLGVQTWTTLLDESRAPWSVRDPHARFRWRDAPEVDGVVIELRQNVDAGNAHPDIPRQRDACWSSAGRAMSCWTCA